MSKKKPMNNWISLQIMQRVEKENQEKEEKLQKEKKLQHAMLENQKKYGKMQFSKDKLRRRCDFH